MTEKFTEAELAARIRAQVKEVAPKAIKELTRQYESAVSPKRKLKIEARAKDWIKLLSIALRDDAALNKESSGEKGVSESESGRENS